MLFTGIGQCFRNAGCSEEMTVVSRGNFYRLTGNPEGERLTGRDFNGTVKGFLGKGIQSQI